MTTATAHAYARYINEDKLLSARLVMLGTIHRDREAGVLLSRWLDYLKPDVITLEFSGYGLMFRKMHGAELRSRIDGLLKKTFFNGNPAAQALYDYVDLPYEYRETSRYALHSGIPLYLLDSDLFSAMKLRELKELINEKNLQTWFAGNTVHENEIAKEKTLARLFFDRGIKTSAYTDEMLTRDKHIRAKLTLLLLRCEPKRILHVCGWQHLVDAGELYHSLHPVKVFVHDRPICI